MLAAEYGFLYGFVGVLTAFYYMLTSVISILGYVALWKIFKKAGEPGWKSLVPVLNGHTMYKLFWKPAFYYLTIVLAVAVCVPATLLQMQMMEGTTDLALVLITIFSSLAVLVLEIVWSVKFYLGMARSFGYGGGFAAGLFFIPLVFELILAFGKDRYLGNTYEKGFSAKQQPTGEEPWNP